ncbi:MAG: hypoxanthine phosphoribosyltransferase [Spirochaetes bacterium]|nr:hypoxanthine phosphoribosyltransferase [Spirochaetota bacterium]
MKAKGYYKKLGKILLSTDQIQGKIREIASQIEEDYKDSEVVLISNLKGSFRFLSDLVSYLKIPTMIDFIAFASYEGTDSTGHVRIIKDLKTDVKDKYVIIVEDIVDTGYTIDFIIKYLNDFKYPSTIKICALLDKPSRRKIEVPIDYKGFEIADSFIVGYGLDYKEYFRELNDIFIYDE